MFISKLFSGILNYLANLPGGTIMCWQYILDEPECPKSIIER